MRVLLIEPWFDGSHRQWAEGYQRFSGNEVDIVGLPGELWRWRLRGGALPLARLVADWVAEHGRPDVVLVSGLVDVAQLLGLARNALRAVPVAIYQHESQIIYPTPSELARSSKGQGAVLRNWMSWCAADVVLFNSDYHRRTVVERLVPFLAQLPDGSHLPSVEEVVDRFEVLPVGVDLSPFLGDVAADGLDLGRPTDGPIVVWPHRWEADKDPAAFVAALEIAAGAGCRFRLVLAGEEPVAGGIQSLDARRRVVERFGDRVVAEGPFSTGRYRQLLAASDLVVSCAHQECFGIAVVEATAAGCVPVVPNALSYPEVIAEAWHDDVLYDQGQFGLALVAAIDEFESRRANTAGLAASVQRFDWSVVAGRYDDRLASLAVLG